MIILIAIVSGVIIGLLIGILAIVTLAYLRPLIQNKIDVAKTQVENAGPRPKGFIVEPESDAEQARQKIIEKNRKMGRPTPISDLR